MVDFETSNALLRKVLQFIKNSQEYEDPSDMLDLLHKSQPALVNPNPLKRKAPSATDRQGIQSGKVSWKQHSSIELNSDQQTAILALSDELELNEMECLGLWVTVSDSDKRRSLESQLGRRYGSLEMNLPTAARELYSLQSDCELRIVTELFRARYDSSFIPDKKLVIMTETNRLLRDGKVGLNLIRSLSECLGTGGEGLSRLVRQHGGRSQSSSSMQADSASNKAAWGMVQKRLLQLSECLFFAFYQTQIEVSEAAALLELIKQLSELVVGDIHSSAGQSSMSNSLVTSGGFGASTSSSSSAAAAISIRQEWHEGLFQVLVVLQLCHVCALEQIRTLYSRHVDAPPFCSPEVGNAIKPPVGSKDGLDRPWKNGMASGFACLVFALLREPYVDIRDPDYPAAEVVWLVDQASQRQAYSYMRLCMLPVLQAMPNEGNGADFQSILMSVLCDLVHNLLTMFCLPVYDDYASYSFPWFPFPSSRVKLRDDVRWSQEEALITASEEDIYASSPRAASAQTALPSRYSTSELLMRDCQDDMLFLLSALMVVRPSFACPFWVPGKRHPYIHRALDGVASDLSLIVPSLRFLAALASGPGGCTADVTYTFVKTRHPGRFDWSYFFDIIGGYVDQLSPTSQAAGRMSLRQPGAMSTQQPYQAISDADTEVLESIVDLIGMVMRSPSVTVALYNEGFEPVESLFALLSCPVGLSLKGSILRALASACRGSSAAMTSAATETGSGVAMEDASTYASHDATAAAARVSLGSRVVEEIWGCLEHYRLLPITSAMVGGNQTAAPASIGGSNGQQGGRSGAFVGLHYELEAVESSLGMYPVTDGFLSLLLALFQHENGLPANLGYGHRIPGVTCYVDYVVSEVIMKMHRRQFSPELEGEGQRWKITSQAVMVLAAVIQHYTINTLRVEDLAGHHSSDGQRVYSDSLVPQTNGHHPQNPADRKRNVSDAYSSHREGATVPTSLFETPSQISEGMISDFRDGTAHYPLDISKGSDAFGAGGFNAGVARGTPVQRRPASLGRPGTSGATAFPVPRPKTAGFATMCHVLHHSRRLFDLLLNLLKENSPEALRTSRDAEVAGTSWRSLSIIRTVEERRALLSQLQRQEEQERYEGKNRWEGRESYRRDESELEEDLELPRFGWDEFLYDVPFWRHRTVAAVMGLLYEVSLRESSFMSLIRASGPLSIVRSDKGVGDAASLVPVQLESLSSTLSSVLSASSNSPPLCVVADYIAILSEPSTCFPSVPVLAVKILQHVANTQTSHKVLSLIADSSSGDSIISSCTKALSEGNDGFVYRVAQSSSTIRRGGGMGDPGYAFGQVFTPSASQTSEPVATAYDYYFNRAAAVLSLGGADGGIWGLVGRVEDNVREAVMDLLLSTLMPNRLCLCHFLLGLLESVEAVQGGAGLFSKRDSLSSFATRGFTMRPGFPANCLDAVLDLLTPHISGVSLYHHYPIQANKCFELLYRLCAGPLTSEAALQVIWRRRGARNAHFLQPHLFTFLDFSRLNDLLSSGEAGKRGGGDVLQEGARINCLAWTLKILALELHHMELTAHVPRSTIQSLLSLLFDPDTESPADSSMTSGGRWAEEGSSSAQHTYGGSAHGSVLLFQLLHTLPLSTSFDSEGHDSPVVVQCMQHCSRSHSAAQGVPDSKRRNEPPGRFTYVDVRSLALMLQQVWSGSVHTSSGRHAGPAPGAAFGSQADVDKAVDAALSVTVEYNKYNMLVASLANACQAWRQVVDISLLGCGGVMCGLQSTDQDEGAGRRASSLRAGRGEKSILHMADSFSQVAAAVNRIVNFLVLPTINILVSQPAMEMVLAEQFARSLLSMTAVLKDVCTAVTSEDEESRRNPGESTALVSEGQLDDMIVGIVQGILRRGGAQSARSTSSSVFRGILYTCLVHLMRFGDSQSSAGDRDSTEWFLEHGISKDDDFKFRCMSLLEPYAVDLVDVAGGDAAAVDKDGSTAVSRMAAFSVLGCVLSALGPSGDGCEPVHQSASGTRSATGHSTASSRFTRNTHSYRDNAYYGSTVYIQALCALRDRGHLERILLTSGLTNSKSTTLGSDIRHQDGIFEATLTLCAHIACSTDGAHILVDFGVLECINSLPPVQVPSSRGSSGQEETFSISTAYAGSRRRSGVEPDVPITAVEAEVTLTPLLRLLRSIAAASSSVLVLKHCAQFMVRNRPVVSYFLRLYSPTLKGLRVVHSIVSIMCMIAPISVPQHHSEEKSEPARSSQSGVTPMSLWELEMGPDGDSFTSDLCRLGRVLGAKPTRQWQYMDAGGVDSFQLRGGSGDERTSWWAAISPSSPYEEQLKEWYIDPPPCLRLLRDSIESEQWSRFDAAQFTLGLQILDRVSSFFRIRSDMWPKGSWGASSREASDAAGRDVAGMSAVDIEDLMYTFQSCACFYLRVCEPSAKSTEQNAWLTDADALSAPTFGSSVSLQDRRGGLEVSADGRDSGFKSSSSEVDREVRRLLLHSAESLFCAAYDFLASVSPAERAAWATQITACLQVSDAFPPHSFIRQIARCLEEVGVHQ